MTEDSGSACPSCGAELPARRDKLGPWKPAPPEVYRIITTGPNGKFEAVFTREEWLDRTVAGRAAKTAAMRLIHRQAGHTWELGI